MTLQAKWFSRLKPGMFQAGVFQNGVAACVLCAATMTGVGCKKSTPAPQPMAIRNPDGSITEPNGSVVYPPGVTPPASSGAVNTATPANTATAPTGSTGNTSPAVQAPVTSANTAPAPAPVDRPASQPVVNTPAPIEREPAHLTVPAGTPVTIRTTETLSASRNDVGDRFTGVLERPVVYRGTTIFARGTSVAGEVVAAKRKGRFKGAGDLGIELVAIGRDRVSTSEYERAAKGRGKRTAGFIGGGGGLGALIGGLAGGGKGALIGGLAGAGAGTAATAYTGSRDVVIPSESVITFRLRSSLTR